MKIQTAAAGKTLTNGDSYSDKVYLPDDAELWQEVDIPEEELTDTEALKILTGEPYVQE